MKRGMWMVGAALAASMAGAAAMADTFSTYGDTTVVGGNYHLASGPSGVGYSGLEDHITTSGLTPNSLSQLSADYEMIDGTTFGGGAPRFTLFDGANNSAYIYWGTPIGGGSFTDPNLNSTVLNNTGNYADLASTDVRVYSNGFGGLAQPNTGVTWAQFVTQVGSTPIAWITLDLDGGWGSPQAMLVRNFTVNGDVASPVPLPASAWAGMALLGVLAITKRRKSAAVPA